MFECLIICFICFILAIGINSFLSYTDEPKDKEKIMSITVKKDGKIISHKDVYR